MRQRIIQRAEQTMGDAALRLDLPNERLWRGEQAVDLTAKSFAVLRYLHEHPARVVTKEELLKAVWPDTYVVDTVLKTAVWELRRALGDQSQAAKFIETAHRRGYRLLKPLPTAPPVQSSRFQVPSQQEVASSQHSVGSREKAETQGSQLIPENWQLTTPLVGREAELAQLQQHLEKALNGERQIVFVSGESGVGKTTLTEAFLSGIGQQTTGNGEQENQKAKGKRQKAKVGAGDWRLGTGSSPQPPSLKSQVPRVWLGWGQCLEHYGASEAYQPMLEALSRLARGVEGEQVIDVLRQYAPTWLLQMPTLLAEEEIEALQRKVSGFSQERMLREMQEAVEALTSVRPLVLWFEDVQWSDYSTLDLIASLANRRDPARLLVIATYRPTEVAAKEEHPLQKITAELRLHRQCEDISLGFFTVEEVNDYLTARFPDSTLSGELTAVLHQLTDGNPLFLTAVVDELVRQQVIVDKKGRWELTVSADEVRANTPESVRQMIDQQMRRLPKKAQRLLEAASVVGQKFSSVVLTTALAESVEQIEEQCEELARVGQLVRTQEMEHWPDGTVAMPYAFRHPLYRDVVYQQLTASQRIRTHQRIGDRLEEAYGKRAREVAAELSMHFEQGERYEQAAKYLHHAAEKALQRGATREAVDLLTHGLMLLRKAPENPRRAQQEQRLQIMLGTLLVSTKGAAASEIEQSRRQVQKLRQAIGETRPLFPVLCGLWAAHFAAADLSEACKCGEQLLRLAKRERDATLQLSAHYLLGTSFTFRGEFVEAQQHLQHARSLFDRQEHEFLTFFHEEDPEILCLSLEAFVLWHLGSPDQALTKAQQAVSVAHSFAHPVSIAQAVTIAVLLEHLCRNKAELQGEQHPQKTVKPESELAGFFTNGYSHRTPRLQSGFTAIQLTGGKLLRPYALAVVADTYGEVGQSEEGLAVLDEAFAQVQTSGEGWWEAELYRLKGELLLQRKRG